MKELRQKIGKYLQAEMLQKMWKEFRWIFQYARRYWKAMLFLYGAWHFRNRCFTGIECDLKGSCRYHYRPPDRKADSDLCADDRIFLWKYPDFPGDQLCLDDD